jgi:hypothetical protein
LYKGAISDAIKKAATLFGVGLDLYGPDYEAGEIDDQPVSQRPAPARNAPTRPQDQRSAPEPSVHASDTDPRRASLLRAFHVALDGHDIPHDSAHKFFKRTRGFDSLTVVPDTELRGLMQTLSKLNRADAQDYIRTGITTGTLPGMPAPAAPRGRAGDDAHTR